VRILDIEEGNIINKDNSSFNDEYIDFLSNDFIPSDNETLHEILDER